MNTLKMKGLLLLLVLAFGTVGFAQKKYPSLLWEITGNGLKKPSYLYGTMHVSKKLAFHLSDTFFLAIKNVEEIGLETNPEFWLKGLQDVGMNDMIENIYARTAGQRSGFYAQAFDLKVPENPWIANTMANDVDNINQLLYRFTNGSGNSEENTYLDLFIFQSAKKLNKKVSSLEDFKKSMEMVSEASVPDENEKQKPYAYNPENYKIMEKVSDAYRLGDLDAIDSLMKLTYHSKKYENYMILLRNAIMANSIDSILHKNSLFSGIGAAHLPGDKGVISLLRQKGYTLRPIYNSPSRSGNKNLTEIDNKKVPLPLSSKYAPDSVAKMDLPGEMYELYRINNSRLFLCTDMVNGAYYTLTEINTYAHFSGMDEKAYQEKIDSLLYENIPGKIIKVKDIVSNNGYKGIDVLNQTRRGDYQRLQIFFAPDRLYIFKMGATGDFAKRESDKFFKSIAFTANSAGWDTYTPPQGGFSVEMPANRHVDFNKSEYQYICQRVQAYEPQGDGYFFVAKALYNDINYLEEDTFELNQFVIETAKTLNAKVLSQSLHLDARHPSIDVKLEQIRNKAPLSMRIYIQGPEYYLLMAASRDAAKTDRFFQSFRFTENKYPKGFELYHDTLGRYTTMTDYKEKPKSILSSMINQRLNGNGATSTKEKQKDYEAKYEEHSILSESGEHAVNTEMTKFHAYYSVDSVEAFWRYRTSDFIDKGDRILKHKIITRKGKLTTYDILVTDTGTTRGIWAKWFLRDGMLHQLTTVTDSAGNTSEWVRKFYDNFTPDTLPMTVTPFVDKTDEFLKDLASADTNLRKKAESFAELPLTLDRNAKALLDFMKRPAFDSCHTYTKLSLIRELGSLKHPEILDYLKTLYAKYADSASFQPAILSSMVRQQTAVAMKEFGNLMVTATPLSGGDEDMEELFYPLYDSLKLTATLYPALLELTRYPEYKHEVYGLLETLLDSACIQGPAYASFKQAILREANDELKRENTRLENSANTEKMSREEAEAQAKREADRLAGDLEKSLQDALDNVDYDKSSYSGSNSSNYELRRYAVLLAPFYAEPQVKSFFDKLVKVKNEEQRMDYNLLMLKNKLPVQDSVWHTFSANPDIRLQLYRALSKEKRLNLFDTTYATTDYMSKALLYGGKKLAKTDSIVFVDSIYIVNKKHQGYIWVYKSKIGEDAEWELDYAGYIGKNGKIPDAFQLDRSGIRVKKTMTLDEQLKEIKDRLRLEGRRRAGGSSYSSYDYNSYGDD